MWNCSFHHPRTKISNEVKGNKWKTNRMCFSHEKLNHRDLCWVFLEIGRTEKNEIAPEQSGLSHYVE